MVVGDKVKLVEDLFSSVKKNQYAKKGDTVTITSIHHWPVLLVEDKKGERFAVHINKVNK